LTNGLAGIGAMTRSAQMSALSQKRKSQCERKKSALPRKLTSEALRGMSASCQ
jgi:hypothetical protein